jgi:hypothetical protein
MGRKHNVSSELTHCKHHPRIFTEVRFPSMPKPKIANDDTTFLDNGLRWWSDFATSVKEMLLYPSTSTIAVFTLLIGDSSSLMCAKPDFCRAVLRCHCYERNVYHKCEGN